MVSQLIVNRNSYATLEEAETYLEDSLRASETWCDLSTETQTRALLTATRQIEAARFQGLPTGLEIVDTVVVTAGGSGYAVDDEITVDDGVGVAAVVRVTSVSTGVVTGVTLIDAGAYSTSPTSPAATTTDGSGTGCTLTLTLIDQILHFPATGVVDRTGAAVDSASTPQRIKDGQIQLAFEMASNSQIETAGGVGSNTKRLKAGDVEVEYFVASGGVGGTNSRRWPPVVMDLLGEYLASAAPVQSLYAGGTDEESSFDDDRYGLSEGL